MVYDDLPKIIVSPNIPDGEMVMTADGKTGVHVKNIGCGCVEHERVRALEQELEEAVFHIRALQGWVHSDICGRTCVNECREAFKFLSRAGASRREREINP